MGGPDLFQALHFFGSAEAGASNWNLIYNKDIANEDNKKRGVTNTWSFDSKRFAKVNSSTHLWLQGTLSVSTSFLQILARSQYDWTSVHSSYRDLLFVEKHLPEVPVWKMN